MMARRRPQILNLQIVITRAADCSISLKFGTDLAHMTHDVLHVLKVKLSKLKVTRDVA